MQHVSERLSWLLAAVVSGFAFIGLSYLMPEAFETLGVVLFIIGVLAVVTFAGAIIVRALTALIKRQTR